MTQRTYDDIAAALLADETWEIPEEMRPMIVELLPYTLNQL